MRFLWANLALAGAASAMHPYLDEAMRGERVRSGYHVYDEPEWEPKFDDESAPYRGFRVPREEWKLSCSSENSKCEYATDGTNDTAWRSLSAVGTHSITIDLRDHYAVGAVVILPPLNLESQKGLITDHQIHVSNDNITWFGPVAYGMWPNTNRQRLAAFEPVSARFIRLDAKTLERSWVGISEINVYANLYTIPQDPANRGVWGPTIDLPVVPAAAAQEAGGQIMLWSSWDDDQFHSTPGGKTAMARWDYRTHTVTKRVVTDTQHDMFCPGIAIDGTGMMIVTGGNDAAQTSIYNAFQDKWEPATAMNIERGYQAQTTLSDGRVFVIGGSWAGNSNLQKNGEVYDPATRNWTMLPDAKVEPMYTRDMEGPWRADNHGWLFGWKDNTVFQAGPSVNMHWYRVNGTGSVVSAGERVGGEDSMSGNAVMFDAVAGKILTFGGSPDYDKSWANAYASIITLGEPGKPVTVEKAGDGAMSTERVFHTSVVLPDGTVFIVGGQDFGIAFNEEGVKFTPELYDPKTNKFTLLQKNNLIRVYHSVSILAPDATVLTGGGGLCGNCSANHYDAQVYTPPYLLNKDGSYRKRPEFIPFVRTSSFPIGDIIEFRSLSDIKEAALVRLSSASHTVNTDQRRVPLKVEYIGRTWKGEYRYQTRLPTDAGILIPGQWMYFIIDKAGTPSVAEIIHIRPNEQTSLSDGPYSGHESIYGQAEPCEQGQLNALWHHLRPTKLISQILRRRLDSN